MMASKDSEIAHEFFPNFPIFRVYKDGRIERLRQIKTVPPSDDPLTGVQSKDFAGGSTGSSECPSGRLFLPNIANPTAAAKIPLLIYIHGGAFCLESPFSPTYHNYLVSLVSKSNVIAVSVNYRKAPEFLLPIAYDDASETIKWVASHANGDGPEPWLNNHADFSRVFLAGDSAGANIAHNMTMKSTVLGLKINGLIFMNPFFLNNNEPDKLIEFIFPSSRGCDDPRLNPGCAEELAAGLACKRVLVCVAEKDFLRERGLAYYETVQKSGWDGEINIFDTPEEGHVFFLSNPSSQKAVDLMNQVSSFLNR